MYGSHPLRGRNQARRFRFCMGARGAVAPNINRKISRAVGAKKIWQFSKKITPILLIFFFGFDAF